MKRTAKGNDSGAYVGSRHVFKNFDSFLSAEKWRLLSIKAVSSALYCQGVCHVHLKLSARYWPYRGDVSRDPLL